MATVEEFLEKTDDVMNLERVRTMDEETAAEIFGWSKPTSKKTEEESSYSSKKAHEELAYQEMLARQRQAEKARRAREQEDEDGLCR